MRARILGLLTMGLLAAPLGAQASLVFLDGYFYLQRGSFTNAAGVTATTFVYSLGTAEDDVASWDGNSGSCSTGTASDFLSEASHFQTCTWSGLSVASGSTFNFSGFDIDRITVLSPLTAGTEVDTVGTTLRNAYVSIGYADGSACQASLNQTGWRVDQNLTCSASVSVPEPGTLALLGLGLAGLAFTRRRNPAGERRRQ